MLLIVLALLGVYIYWKFIRPEKEVYDRLRRARDQQGLMEYHQQLAKKHGPVFLIGYGPLIRLVVLEPDMLADVFSRTNASYYAKPLDFTTVLKPIGGVHNLLVSEGVEHERARKMLNPAFHFRKLQAIDLQNELNLLTLLRRLRLVKALKRLPTPKRSSVRHSRKFSMP